MTATEVARKFSEVIDHVERTAEEITIVRHGRPVARLCPPVQERTGIRRLPSGGDSSVRPQSGTEVLRRRFPAVEEILDPKPGIEESLRLLLAGLEDLDCTLTPPTGEKRSDYINVHATGIRGRIAGVNARTGRVEFQSDSWDSLHSMSPKFARLAAGNKAASPLDGKGDVPRLLRAAEAEILRRRR